MLRFINFHFVFFAVQPGHPSNLRSLETNATTLKLTWREGFKGNSPITKYLVQGNNETGFANNHDSLWFDALVVIDPYKYHNLPPVIIRSLRPFTTYRFRVKAWNKVAASDFSAKSGEITTQQAAPESPPLNLQVKPPRYPGELTLTWTVSLRLLTGLQFLFTMLYILTLKRFFLISSAM